ncbi:MCE family protein [Mycolicibacterium septicum DSM 44393]|uniref:MCE family protein n=1 Tax=Mycolicibacterium septicum DSM 44393 TaxID=1341646 RepID=A0A7X6MN52_9MYCO|nr:MlaD family protein [Mycolicibacterium septicum]NKZ10833.1 MCE family protein [Mycolicibacterium septicum DSM 44393]
MSTVFSIRNLQWPRLRLRTVIALAVAGAVAIMAINVGWRLYQRVTTTTVTAFFPEANALYPGDKVQIMGFAVGAVDEIEPAGGRMKVTFHFDAQYQVPADAYAAIINPSLVASRAIELTPVYRGGPTLTDGAVIPLERTQVPVEWDDLRGQVTRLLDELGPTPETPAGPIGQAVSSLADGLAGKGAQLRIALTNLSQALTALSEGRGDFFAVIRSVAEFSNTLHQNDQKFVALNANLAQFTDGMTQSDRQLADAVQQIDALLSTVRTLVRDNGSPLSHGIDNLEQATSAIVAPTPRDGLETALHVLPNMAANSAAMYEPAHGAITAQLQAPNFANPLQMICSSVQAASRLGYQESAELCAQYLAPVLDAIKFNYPPVGLNLASTADTVPDQVAYSEERLRPPPGYKDTTVPGVWAVDSAFSHGNHEPGWKIAPGMDGLQLQLFTQNMLAPEDLAGLLANPTAGGTG